VPETAPNGGSVSASSSLGVATTAGLVSLFRHLGDPAMRVVMAAGSAIIAAEEGDAKACQDSAWIWVNG
jgi:hypothetical protein